jgi:hypothetical protein
MKIDHLEPPRRFDVGAGAVTISHVASITLADDEQVTFVSAAGTQYDVVRKDWGYYATASLQARLPDSGLAPVLVRNTRTGRAFLLLVERGAESRFRAYCEAESLEVVARLDTPAAVDRLCDALQAGRASGEPAT